MLQFDGPFPKCAECDYAAWHKGKNGDGEHECAICGHKQEFKWPTGPIDKIMVF